MNLRNAISALFCFFLGLAFLVRGVHLGLKAGQNMGPGFFPIVAGGTLAFLSIILLAQTLRHRRSPEPKRSFWVDPRGWKRVFLTFLATAAYPFMLNHLGFFLSTLCLLFFLFGAISRLKWWIVGAGGGIAATSFYLVFEVWLKVNLPRGLLSF